MTQDTRMTDEVSFQAFQFLLSFLLTLPLAAHWVAGWIGWRIFFLGDPRIQLVWASLLLFACVWPFFVGALRGRGARRTINALLTAATLGLFGYGIYLTFWRMDQVTHPFFQFQAVLITVATLDRLTAAVLRRRRNRTH